MEYKTNKLIGATQFSEYMTGSILLGFSWAFCLPFIQGLLASMDSHGSAVASVSGASTIGGAAGPALATIVVGTESYQRIFYFAMGLFLFSLLSFFLSYSESK